MTLATILRVILVHFPQVGKNEEYGKVVLFLEEYIDPKYIHVVLQDLRQGHATLFAHICTQGPNQCVCRCRSDR